MDIKAELKVYKNWIFNNMPIGNLDVNILCTYVEAFKIPFKLTTEKLISYNKGAWKLFLRPEETEEVNSLVNDGIANTAEALGRYPSSFMLVPTSYRNHIILNPFGGENPVSIGICTGRYYFDIYGYCWFEMNGHLMPDPKQIVWVRETAIDYEGKADMQELINENRRLVEEMRLGRKKKKNSKLLTFLTIGLTLLQSR